MVFVYWLMFGIKVLTWAMAPILTSIQGRDTNAGPKVPCLNASLGTRLDCIYAYKQLAVHNNVTLQQWQ